MSSDRHTNHSASLSAEQRFIMKQKGTERPGSSALNYEKRSGLYYCAACHAPLFRSETKYESGSGWPSFFAPYSDEAIETHEDNTHGMQRIEICCAQCHGHLGHVFDDGPAPTGERYCVNGLSLTFEPAE